MKTTVGAEEGKAVYKLDRITDDVHGFRERIALEKEERANAVRTAYDEDDVDLYDE
jgi:hypothetical protein